MGEGGQGKSGLGEKRQGGGGGKGTKIEENRSRRAMYGDVVSGKKDKGGVNSRTLETGTGIWVRVSNRIVMRIGREKSGIRVL